MYMYIPAPFPRSCITQLIVNDQMNATANCKVGYVSQTKCLWHNTLKTK